MVNIDDVDNEDLDIHDNDDIDDINDIDVNDDNDDTDDNYILIWQIFPRLWKGVGEGTGFFLCQTTFQRNVAQSREMWPEMWPIML